MNVHKAEFTSAACHTELRLFDHINIEVGGSVLQCVS